MILCKSTTTGWQSLWNQQYLYWIKHSFSPHDNFF
jgi:hypothetical protein